MTQTTKKENWEGVFEALEKCFEVELPSKISADYCSSCCGGEFIPTEIGCNCDSTTTCGS